MMNIINNLWHKYIRNSPKYRKIKAS